MKICFRSNHLVVTIISILIQQRRNCYRRWEKFCVPRGGGVGGKSFWKRLGGWKVSFSAQSFIYLGSWDTKYDLIIWCQMRSGVVKGSVTTRWLGPGRRRPFEVKVHSFHAAPRGIMLKIYNIEGTRPPRPPRWQSPWVWSASLFCISVGQMPLPNCFL